MNAVTLLCDGVFPTEETVEVLIAKRLIESLLLRLSKTSFRGEVGKAPIRGAVERKDSHIATLIMGHALASDSMMKEGVCYAVTLRLEKFHLDLLQASPRARRVFLQNFSCRIWEKGLGMDVATIKAICLQIFSMCPIADMVKIAVAPIDCEDYEERLKVFCTILFVMLLRKRRWQIKGRGLWLWNLW